MSAAQIKREEDGDGNLDAIPIAPVAEQSAPAATNEPSAGRPNRVPFSSIPKLQEKCRDLKAELEDLLSQRAAAEINYDGTNGSHLTMLCGKIDFCNWKLRAAEAKLKTKLENYQLNGPGNNSNRRRSKRKHSKSPEPSASHPQDNGQPFQPYSEGEDADWKPRIRRRKIHQADENQEQEQDRKIPYDLVPEWLSNRQDYDKPQDEEMFPDSLRYSESPVSNRRVGVITEQEVLQFSPYSHTLVIRSRPLPSTLGDAPSAPSQVGVPVAGLRSRKSIPKKGRTRSKKHHRTDEIHDRIAAARSAFAKLQIGRPTKRQENATKRQESKRLAKERAKRRVANILSNDPDWDPEKGRFVGRDRRVTRSMTAALADAMDCEMDESQD
ncbi:hypothetical protein OQA88_9124 [Cercophora sp. LCS_1]